MTDWTLSLNALQAQQLAMDPQARPEDLAALAASRPELWALIARNPAAYDDLLDWLAARRKPGVDAALAGRPGYTFVAPPEPPVQSPAAPEAGSPRRRNVRRTAAIGIASAVVVAVLVIAALAFAGTPLKIPSALGGAAASDSSFTALTAHGQAPARTSTTGLALSWSTSAADLGYPSSAITVVAQTPTVWVLSIVSTGADDQQAGALVGVSATSGSEIWHNDSVGGSCAGPVSEALVCITGTGSYGIGTAASLTLTRVSISDGTVTTGKTLQQLGFTGDQLYASLRTAGGSVLLSVEADDVTNFTQPTTFEFARLTDDFSSVLWNTTQTDCNGGGDNWPSVTRVENGVLVQSDAMSHEVLDFATGKSLAQVACQETDLFGSGGVLVGGDTVGTSVLDSSRISALITGRGGDGEPFPVDFSSSGHSPSVPVEFESASDGTMTVSAQKLDGSGPSWSKPVVLHGSSQDPDVYGAAGSGRLVLVDTAGHVVSVDPSTGSVLWSALYPSLHTDSTGAAYVPVSVSFGPGDTVLVTDVVPGSESPGSTATFATYVFNAASGQQLDAPAGWSAYSDGTADAQQTALSFTPAIIPITGNASIGAVVATTTSARAIAQPSTLPACPSGYRAISWSSVRSGYVLLCSGHGGYRSAVRLSDKSVSCSTVRFTTAGYELVCSGSRILTITGGGSILQSAVTGGGHASIVTASAGWSIGSPTAVSFGGATTAIGEGCPAGSELLALSRWKKGWLFVCGTDAVHPSSLTFRDGSSSGTSSSVTYGSGRYCASRSAGGTVCATGTPAVVSFTDSSGATTQRPVEHNYFVSEGASGIGQGTGAYDVTAPKDTADDEVRYLDQILHQSTAGRAQAVDLVNDIANCTPNPTDVQTAASLVANRTQLVSALGSAPVDRIPNGSRLVSELTSALEASLQADQTYQTAVADLNSSGCPAATQDMGADPDLESKIGTLKSAFISDWNSAIVGSYGTAAAFTSGQI